MNRFNPANDIEPKMLKWVLIVSTVFWFSGVIKGLIWDGGFYVMMLDYGSFMLSALCLLAYQRGTDYRWVAFTFCFLWVPLFGTYWVNMGGVDGPFSYAFFLLMVIYIALLHAKVRYFMIVLLSLVCLGLIYWSEQGVFIVKGFESTPASSLESDYVISTCILTIVVVFMKRRFDRERSAMMMRNAVLNHYNEELEEKRKRLLHQKEILGHLNNNLESLVKDRTQEQELKNSQLQDYAYNNAHIIRGPLTSIMALVQLMKSEMIDDSSLSKDLDGIEKNAISLDQVVRKINQTLH